MGKGRTKALIEQLIRLRTKGNPALTHFVTVHLVLQGIDPAEHTADSVDREEITHKLEKMIRQFSTGAEA